MAGLPVVRSFFVFSCGLRYEPFEHSFAPYDASKESLYRAFGPADRLTVFKRLFMADTAYAGDAKV